MEKYYVTRDIRFVAQHELSVSNGIVGKEDVTVILDIVRKWVNEVFPNNHYIVYYKGNTPSIDMFTIHNPNAIGDKTCLNIFHTKSNVRFRIGVYETEYKIEHAIR